MTKDELVQEYGPRMEALLPLARKAYGSRDIVSPQHDASREYTRLAVEFYGKGGSLLSLAKYLKVTYAGLRRRVMTDEIPVSTTRHRSKATPEEVAISVERILNAKSTGDIENYHRQLRHEYEVNNVSLAKIAKGMGLSSANPLYYAVNRVKIMDAELTLETKF
jgi:hypothetical protein